MSEDEEIRQAIRALAAEGKASCKALLDLANRTGSPPKRLGRLCNDMKIKICACQLGCFR